MTIVKNNLFLILAIVLSVFAFTALVHPGFFPIHDDEQIARLFELNYSLESGHIPPRISQNLGFGYGYPFFNFYPSFVYYFAEIFVILGFSYIASVKIMIAFGFIFAAGAMYLFSKEYLGRLGGLAAAVLYTYAPYHSVDVYVRGALPEFWAFVFIPVIFWALSRLSKDQKFGNIILLGLFGAGLMITHNLVLLMSVPFIATFFFFILYQNKNRRSYFTSIALGGLISLLLSSYFWIPAILENKYTMVSLLTNQLASYGLHFVSLSQFVNSAWGYGGSILGPYDGLSLEVGKIHLILAVIALAFFLFDYLKYKRKHVILLIFFFMFILSIFLQSYYSKSIWDSLPALSYIQFPWRFMLFSVFSASFIGGYLFVFKFDQKVKYVLIAGLILVILLFYGPLFKPSEYLLDVKDENYTGKDVLRWKTSKMAFEYVPSGIATKKSDLNTTIVDIEENEIAKEAATPLSENISLKTLIDKPQYKKIEVNTIQRGKIQINTYSFPGWKVFINGKEISYNDKNKLRLITIDIPDGHSIIEAKFTETQVRKTGNLFTILSFGLIISLLPFYSKKIKL